MNLVCSSCRAEKPSSEFHSNRALSSGFANWCKECRSTRKPGGVKKLVCETCGSMFLHRGSNTPLSCSPQCRLMRTLRQQALARQARPRRACVVCDNELPFRKGAYKTCGPTCSSTLGRAKDLSRRFGVSLVDALALLATETCAACGEPFVVGETPCVDHCHAGGHVRGAIHRKCNVGLGMAEDDPDKLLAWATYLTRDQFDLRDLCLQ